jgi:hypothetical protein
LRKLLSRGARYDNPSVYCDDLAAIHEHIDSMLQQHIYVRKPAGDRFKVDSTPGVRKLLTRKTHAHGVIQTKFQELAARR